MQSPMAKKHDLINFEFVVALHQKFAAEKKLSLLQNTFCHRRIWVPYFLPENEEEPKK